MESKSCMLCRRQLQKQWLTAEGKPALQRGRGPCSNCSLATTWKCIVCNSVETGKRPVGVVGEKQWSCPTHGFL